MAGRLMNLLYRPGWRMRCIDPPLGWLRISDELPPVVEFRLQVTCYLTSQWASPVLVRELQLRVNVDEREFVVPWTATADKDDTPLGEKLEYKVGAAAPRHAFVDFASDAPDLISLIESVAEPIPVQIEGRFNMALEFRSIAAIGLSVEHPLPRGRHWQRVKTGRELTE